MTELVTNKSKLKLKCEQVKKNPEISSDGQRFYKLRIPSVGRIWENGTLQSVDVTSPRDSDIHCNTYQKFNGHII